MWIATRGCKCFLTTTHDFKVPHSDSQNNRKFVVQHSPSSFLLQSLAIGREWIQGKLNIPLGQTDPHFLLWQMAQYTQIHSNHSSSWFYWYLSSWNVGSSSMNGSSSYPHRSVEPILHIGWVPGWMNQFFISDLIHRLSQLRLSEFHFFFGLSLQICITLFLAKYDLTP